MNNSLFGSKKSKKVNPQRLPLSPQEMDTELLDTDIPAPQKKLAGMRVSPYTDNEQEYQGLYRRKRYGSNDNSVDREEENDPEYEEYLEYKRMKREKGKSMTRSLKDIITPNEQFNELLLYVFTGFFLLMIYDNIYKLGRQTY